MRWRIHHGDLLSVPADILVCSANVYLNLSGGVGGAFNLRYGSAMQEALHDCLREQGVRHVPRGTLMAMPPCGSPYLAVLHAVAVDGAYESSPEIVRELFTQSLGKSAKLGAKSIALAALATGYGRMDMLDFAAAIKPLLGLDFPPVSAVTIALRNQFDVEELIGALPRDLVDVG
jgi:O-acetyl-ADP-ribose deacetylase (regulator of RNase III)